MLYEYNAKSVEYSFISWIFTVCGDQEEQSRTGHTDQSRPK